MVIFDTIFIGSRKGQPGLHILNTNLGTFYELLPAPPLRLSWWPAAARSVAA